MRQFSYPNSQFTTILGGASIGWKLNVYDTGTTDYASIYSNLAQTTPTANPVIADADGFLASFYWTGTVDVVLTDENDNIIDSANGIQDLVSTINAVVVAGNISLPFGTAAGDGNTITATLPITSDFIDGGVFVVRANAANTGASNTPNLQINSYASRRIKKIGGSALVANDIVSGMNCLLVYNLAQDCYYLLNPNASYLNRDGTAAMTGALNMGNQKITSVAAGTADSDVVNYLQLGGDAAREFLAATATTGSAVVNKTQAEALASAAVVSAMPTGAMIMWPTSTAPSGFVEAAGQSTAPYPSLAPIYGSNLPDMRGEFVRGFDNGRGVDSGRAICSFQADDIKAHTHSVTTYAGVNSSVARIDAGIMSGESGNSTGSTGGTETRPRNVSMMYIIKT